MQSQIHALVCHDIDGLSIHTILYRVFSVTGLTVVRIFSPLWMMTIVAHTVQQVSIHAQYSSIVYHIAKNISKTNIYAYFANFNKM